ncbi:hypothetical protein LTR67_008404 [Exophiala xenobiotica]
MVTFRFAIDPLDYASNPTPRSSRRTSSPLATRDRYTHRHTIRHTFNHARNPSSPSSLVHVKASVETGRHAKSQQSADKLGETLAEIGIESSHPPGYVKADSDHILTVDEGGDPSTLALDVGAIPSREFEDVGLPPDGLWDHYAAYGQRFCYDHGEYEYLLGTRDRWMRLSDFDTPKAEIQLEVLLQGHRDRPGSFDPHARQCQAECRGNLFSHVHTVAEKREQDGVTLYWIKWKTCWTPESGIDDKDWLPASMEVNRNPHCRRSPRQKDDLKKKEYHKKVMLVKNVD